MITVTLALLAAAGCAQYERFAWGPIPDAFRTYPVEGKWTSGNWEGSDLSLSYNYLKTNDVLDMKGDIDFRSGTQTNFESIDALRVVIYFLGDRGEILGQHGLYNSDWATSEASPEFHARMTLPQGAKSFAFGYEGEASSAGGAGEKVSAWIHDGPR
jgi:hypothetical protein